MLARSSCLWLSGLCAVLYLTPPSYAAILRVKHDAPGPAHDGSSWATAFLTVPDAIGAASSDDQVWVAAGTYTGVIAMKNRLQVYGGFAGTETALGTRNPAANETILDGGQQGAVVSFPAETEATTRLDGFTIRNGSGHGPNGAALGGGIYVEGGSPSISNNVIHGNRADRGGGIYLHLSGSPQITGNTVRNNVARLGGGIYSNTATPVISGNVIADNQVSGNAQSGLAGGSGAGIFASRATVDHNVITGNRAITASSYLSSIGGGALCSGAITDNLFADNSALRGAGLACGPGAVVRRNVFRHNTTEPFPNAQDTPGGGGLFFESSIAATEASGISDNLFTGNAATNPDGGLGGAMWVRHMANAALSIANNTVADNTATVGGGLHVTVGATPAVVANNIVAFNSSGIQANNSPVLRYNDVFGNGGANYRGIADPTGTNGNISSDPLFADRPSGNHHLLPGSPAIDAGDSALVPAGATDLEGRPRIAGPAVDMGAYEAPLIIVLADAALALKSAGGLASLDSGEFARLNSVPDTPEAVTVQDAVDLARRAAGRN